MRGTVETNAGVPTTTGDAVGAMLFVAPTAVVAIAPRMVNEAPLVAFEATVARDAL